MIRIMLTTEIGTGYSIKNKDKGDKGIAVTIKELDLEEIDKSELVQ